MGVLVLSLHRESTDSLASCYYIFASMYIITKMLFCTFMQVVLQVGQERAQVYADHIE